MLTIYRRHLKRCDHRDEGRDYRRCRCPLWADGYLGARDMRLSLDTRDWERAQEIVRKWESDGRGPLPKAAVEEQAISVAAARKQFIDDAKARNLCESSLSCYGLLLHRLQKFAEIRRITALADLNMAALAQFRAQWEYSNLTAMKQLERLRSFFRFCHDNGWVPENPAARLKNPRVIASPTLPYSQEEILKAMKKANESIAAARPDTIVGAEAKLNTIRLRSLLLLLRYSGLRIGDAVSCPVERLVDGKLRLYTQKTGTHVSCPLPGFVVKELEATPRAGEHHWFWTEKCKLKTAVTDWQQKIRELFKEAGVASGHAHRFRDTFAVGLLMDGVPLERVSIMLGHSSVKITEKHYSPWVRERQEQAEADVRRTWLRDPLAVMENAAIESGVTERAN
jgi:site-specific recombinase XerD